MGSERAKGLALWLVLAGACVWAQAQAQGRVTGGLAEAPRVKVHGVVLDRLTRQPLERALVEGTYDAVLTDHDGRFELTLPVGYVGLSARRPGYNRRAEAPVEDAPISADMPEVTLYLTPAATVSGRVSLAGEDDASTLRVLAYRRAAPNGREEWIQAGYAPVDSEGRFRFVQLDTPGKYIFCNAPMVAPGSARSKPMGVARRCYPGGTDFASVTPLDLAAGQQAQIDLELALERFYPVEIASGTDKRPQFRILDSSGMDFPGGSFPTDRPGVVRVMLPNGTYSAETTLWGEQTTYGRADFTVAGRRVDVQLHVGPLTPIPVNIHKEYAQRQDAGGVVARVGVGRGDPNPGMQLMLHAERKAVGAGYVVGMRQVEGGGPDAFEIPAAPGRWRAQVFSSDGYVSSMTSGGVDLLRDPLVVGAGAGGQPIEVTLRNDGGQIECRLSEAAGASAQGSAAATGRMRVVAVAQFPAAMPMHSSVGLNGMTTISNLAPGEYRVAAFDAMPSIDLEDAEQVSRVMSKGQTVHVEANGSARVQLELTRLDEVGAAQ